MTARTWAILVVMLLMAAMLSACTTTPQMQTVRVAVPIQCQAVVPDRPVMPTEALQPGVKLFGFVTAAEAEIERREGYEEKLRAALASCVLPLVAEPAG